MFCEFVSVSLLVLDSESVSSVVNTPVTLLSVVVTVLVVLPDSEDETVWPWLVSVLVVVLVPVAVSVEVAGAQDFCVAGFVGRGAVGAGFVSAGKEERVLRVGFGFVTRAGFGIGFERGERASDAVVGGHWRCSRRAAAVSEDRTESPWLVFGAGGRAGAGGGFGSGISWCRFRGVSFPVSFVVQAIGAGAVSAHQEERVCRGGFGFATRAGFRVSVVNEQSQLAKHALLGEHSRNRHR